MILIDAVPRGGAPGSLYIIEPEVDEEEDGSAVSLDPHSLDPVKVLRFAKTLGGPLPRILLFGCEPTPIEEKTMQDRPQPAGALGAWTRPSSRLSLSFRDF